MKPEYHVTRCSRWLLLALSLPSCSHPQTWLGMPFDHAKAYLYYNIDEKEAAKVEYRVRILSHGVLNPTVVNPEGITLTRSEVDEFQSAVLHATNETSYFCFNPRHALVFYDGDDRPVAWLEICFECHEVAASPQIEDPPDFARLRTLMGQIGLPVFDDPDEYLKWKTGSAAPASDAAQR